LQRPAEVISYNPSQPESQITTGGSETGAGPIMPVAVMPCGLIDI
jgi:hypothetical protein